MDTRSAAMAFCQGCGENVETHRVVIEGRVDRRCVYCGLVLDSRQTALTTHDRAITVDDSPLLRDVLSDLLVERGIARAVTACRDGSEFLAAFTESLAKRDYTVLMAFLMCASAAVVVLNLIADIAVHAIDPRARSAR